MKRIKISLDEINPSPDSVIIAKCYDEDMGLFRAKDLYEQIANVFPNNKVIICPTNIRITEIKEESFWEFIEQLKNLRPKAERERHNT